MHVLFDVNSLGRWVMLFAVGLISLLAVAQAAAAEPTQVRHPLAVAASSIGAIALSSRHLYLDTNQRGRLWSGAIP